MRKAGLLLSMAAEQVWPNTIANSRQWI